MFNRSIAAIVLLIVVGVVSMIFFTNKDGSSPPTNPPIIEEKPDEVVPPPQKDADLELLKSMDLDEKIGQLLIVGYKDDHPTEKVQDLMENYHVGGIILFGRNFSDIESLIETTNQLHSWNSNNKLPLFISIDEEGGTVSRLPQEATKFPDPRILGEINDPSLTNRVGAVIGQELRSLGINMNFAPVLDVVSTTENKLLYKRSFGGNSETVTIHGLEFINGLQSQDVLAVPKHFPGHGNTLVDSHGDLPIIMADKKALLSRDIPPFDSAISSGIDGIMVAHISFPQVDNSELPATKSKIIIDEILRNELNYKGLVITDDIEMLGYAKNDDQLSQGIIESIEAGVDLFIVGHTLETQLTVIEAIKESVENHIITEERIDESVLRIIKAKNKYAIDTVADIQGVKKIVGSLEHKSVLDEISKKTP